jgi:DNA-binding protein HU-beta
VDIARGLSNAGSRLVTNSISQRIIVVQTGGYLMTTTTEIAEKIAQDHGLSKVQGKAIVEAVFQSIAEAAVLGKESSIQGFGKFKVKDSPAREARNPATGATIQVAAARKLSFSPAKALKDTLNK